MSELYADIVLPLAVGVFTFRVGDAIRADIGEGHCVVVPLGPRKLYLGVVWRLHGEKPPYKTIKSVDSFAPDAPVIGPQQRRFWQWIADYYMCTTGEVMQAALPSALKPEGFSQEEFSDESYRPRTVQYVSLAPAIGDEAALNAAFESLKRARKQYDALVSIVELLGEGAPFGRDVPRSSLTANLPILAALRKKNIITIAEREPEQGELPPLPAALPELSEAQRTAANSIREQFRTKEVVLLHGVTGSGKTEIYIRLIERQLRTGRNVLFLMPEIAMTGQMIGRIREWFGERVITYHSKFTMRHRVEAYRRVAASAGGELILGVRSALFLPTDNLGLIIIDEEHDTSYKQEDPAPRYNARDAAIVLARMGGAKVLLGSATPSVESWANAQEGKYGLATLSERYGGVAPPHILISDTATAVKRGERAAHFNKALLDRIAATIARERQVMLFQNRRGFSPYVECGECGRAEMCPHCNVALTYHKAENMLRCHYCGHAVPPPVRCPGCGAPAIEPRGFGTEKVEEELSRLLPDARIERLDRDTATSERRFNSIIASFERGETDILVGTQMITKGFDFAGVALVGILNADNMLFYPDFRAAERAFQMMAQVAGRAGRRDEQGEVVIQTSQPENPVIRQVAAGDYEGMARTQLAERAEFFYPPYCRIISLTLRHRDKALLWDAANTLSVAARKIFGRRLLGPQPPPVDRIRGEHLLVLMLKVERGRSFAEARRLLAESVAKMHADKRFRYIKAAFDVDPQ